MHCNVTSSGKSQYLHHPCLIDMSADARGVLRGHCKACPCDGYSGGPAGLKCVKCNHPPGKHEKLSTSGSTPASSSSDHDVAGQQTQLQSTPKPSSQPQAVLPGLGLKSSPPIATSSFVIGPQLCQVSGCTEEADFDLNTSIQHKLCQEHRKNLPHGLQSLYVTDSDEYGETLSGSSPTTDRVQPLLASMQHQQQDTSNIASTGSGVTAMGTKVMNVVKELATHWEWPWDDYKGTCRQCHQPIMSPVRSRSDTFCSRECCFTFWREHKKWHYYSTSARRIPHKDQTSTGPAAPSLLGSRSTPTLAPQTMPCELRCTHL